MSVSTTAHEGRSGGSPVKLWLGLLFLIAVGIGLAWIGAGGLRPEITSTGLEFRQVKGGTGEPIGPNDVALVDYVGQLDDGTVFDSSSAHGGPQPMTIGQVFPGFAEAMRKMQEGGSYHFKMPPRLAFGEGPPPPGFPANSSLTFDVRVQKVVRGAASMMQGGGPGAAGAGAPPPQGQ